MLEFLNKLSSAGSELQTISLDDSDVSAKTAIVHNIYLHEGHVEDALDLLTTSNTKTDFWDQCQGQKIVMADVARAFAAIFDVAAQLTALQAAVAYTTLLKTQGCPVLGLFDRIVGSSLLKLLRDTAFAQASNQTKKQTKKKTGKGNHKARKSDGEPDSTAMDQEQDAEVEESFLMFRQPSAEQQRRQAEEHQEREDGLERAVEKPEIVIPLLTTCCENVSSIINATNAVNTMETVLSIASAFVDIVSVPWIPKTTRTAAYSTLEALLRKHQCIVPQITSNTAMTVSAMIFKLLTPVILNSSTVASHKVAAKDAGTVRAAAVSFVVDALNKNAENTRQAAAALMRHLILTAPDKVDGRSAACEAALTISRALHSIDPYTHIHSFMVFLVRLSRTSKPVRRMMAVDVAAGLLDVAEDVSAVDWIAGRGGCLERENNNDDDTIEAPWGIVALAILLRRINDKTPAVRARALHHLASIVGRAASSQCLSLMNALSAAEKIDLGVAVLSSTKRESMSTSQEITERKIRQTKEDDGDGVDGSADGGDEDRMNMTDDADGIRTKEEERDQEQQQEQHAGNTPPPLSPSPPSPQDLTKKKIVFLVPASKLVNPNGGEEEEEGEQGLDSLFGLTRLRCRDSKGHVRKSAVTLLQNLILLRAARKNSISKQREDMNTDNGVAGPRGSHSSGSCLSDEDVATIETAAGDSLLTVRKAALIAAAQLASTLSMDRSTALMWVKVGLPLIRDPETAVQDAVLDQVEEIIMDRCASVAASEAGPVLEALSHGGVASKTCLARCCAQLKSKGRLQAKKVALGLESIILQSSGANQGDKLAGAWMVYSEIACHAPTAPSWEFLHSQWSSMLNGGHDVDNTNKKAVVQHSPQLLSVIATAAAEFPEAQATALCAQIRSNLESLTLPPAAAAAHVAALAQLTRSHHDILKRDFGLAEWTTCLLVKCEKALAAAIDTLRKSNHHDDDNEAQSHGSATAPQFDPTSPSSALFIIGEIALLKSAFASSRLITLVQTLTSPNLASDVLLSPPQADQSTIMSQTMSEPIPAATQLTEMMFGQNKGGGGAAVPKTIQALAWVTVGKLCLVNETLAKKCVPLFVQELGRAASPAVRNNIMVVLADLVVHYTALVDSHIPRLAACLRDPNEQVRVQALALLGNLLQKDYVKWRGPLFLRFMLALIDPCPRIVAMAEYLLGDALESKLPNLAYNHFVEALFVLNDCHVGSLDLAGVSTSEREAFSLKGSDPATRVKRDAIYQALLKKMAPEHKFATSARLCQEVLGGVADGALPISECAEVIGDALRVLRSKSIKVPPSRATKDVDAELEDPGTAAASIAGAAKGKIVSQMMKKHLVEAVVPVIIELKRIMEAAKHPLLGDLMATAAAMLKEHKSEIEDILAADRQLAKEILYDIRQAEELEKQQQAAACAGVAEASSVPANSAQALELGRHVAVEEHHHYPQDKENIGVTDVKRTSTSAFSLHHAPTEGRTVAVVMLP